MGSGWCYMRTHNSYVWDKISVNCVCKQTCTMTVTRPWGDVLRSWGQQVTWLARSWVMALHLRSCRSPRNKEAPGHVLITTISYVLHLGQVWRWRLWSTFIKGHHDLNVRVPVIIQLCYLSSSTLHYCCTLQTSCQHEIYIIKQLSTFVIL